MSKVELIEVADVAKIIDRSPAHTRNRVIHSTEFTPKKYWDGRGYKFVREEVENWYFNRLKNAKRPTRKTKYSRINPAQSL